MSGLEIAVLLAIVVGVVGIVVPVLPGLLLIWAAVAVWALELQTTLAWVVLGGATAVAGASQVVKYLVPHRRLREAGVPNRSLLAGGVLGIIGFFVIPVVGLFVGFVLGVYLAERARLSGHAAAWPSTRHAVVAAGLSILIELLAGLLVAVGWLAAALSN